MPCCAVLRLQVLYESLVLVQWVEDYFADLPVSLLPFDPAAKAKARIIANRWVWVRHGGTGDAMCEVGFCVGR